MKFQIIVPSILFLNALMVSWSEGRVVSWVAASTSEALLKGIEPVGLEGDGKTHTFLCRAFETYSMIPGRLVIENGTAFCKNQFNGGEHNHSEFEVLDVPASATSWLPVTAEVPPNTIIAGKHWSGPDSFACRTWVDSELISGAYEYVDELGRCWFGLDGKEDYRSENMEVLVLNAYGTALGLTVS